MYMSLSELARERGVTVATIIRWLDAGKIAGLERTPGGHRRVNIAAYRAGLAATAAGAGSAHCQATVQPSQLETFLRRYPMVSYDRAAGQFSNPTARHMFDVWCDGFAVGRSMGTPDSGVAGHGD